MTRKIKDTVQLIRMIILQNKCIYVISVIFLALGLSFLLLMTSLSESIIKKNRSDLIDKYGLYTSVIADVNDSEISQIKKHLNTYKTSEFQLLDVMEDDIHYTFGIAGSDLLEPFCIQIVSGHWPTSSNEIIIEEFVADKWNLTNKTLPQEITITANNQRYTYTVVGIMENYSNYLSMYQTLEIGINNYPNIMISRNLD